MAAQAPSHASKTDRYAITDANLARKGKTNKKKNKHKGK